MNWFITNRTTNQTKNNKLFDTNIQSKIFIDGYVIPRITVFEQYKHLKQENLIAELYKNFQSDFIHYIKGIFTIIILNDHGFQVYSDRHSIKKYFMYQTEKDFFLSNSLELIAENYALKIDKENAALFSLTSHFFNGNTLFKNVQSSLPAQHLTFTENSLHILSYWNPREILHLNPAKKNREYYASNWSKLIASYVDYISPENISLTLTGGNDSRMVLAALLAQKKKFHTFTFGNPLSYDGFITKELIKEANLDHNFYFVKKPTKEWFTKHAKNLIQFGRGLINIHRAHRNDAIAKEKEHYNTEMLFTGLVGGEYFKEPSYDDVTIPAIFENILEVKDKTKITGIISEELKNKGFNIDKIDLNTIYAKLNNFLIHGQGLKPKEQKFIYTYLFYGCSHHAQDSAVFGEHVKYVVNPFMDIDFIELMPTHPMWYVNKSHNIINSFFHSLFFIEVTHDLAPELSKIPYAKKGKYTANDIVNNKFLYLLKRFSYLIKKDRDHYPPNFPMGEWLYQFCKEELSNLTPEIRNLVNHTMLAESLEQIKTKTTEKNWHIATNPINWNLIYEYYTKN